jgi:hypothetical protein
MQFSIHNCYSPTNYLHNNISNHHFPFFQLKTLQNAHERELSASHETIRILQGRLEEQVTMLGSAKEKRRGPVDYFALKAKV